MWNCEIKNFRRHYFFIFSLAELNPNPFSLFAGFSCEWKKNTRKSEKVLQNIFRYLNMLSIFIPPDMWSVHCTDTIQIPMSGLVLHSTSVFLSTDGNVNKRNITKDKPYEKMCDSIPTFFRTHFISVGLIFFHDLQPWNKFTWEKNLLEFKLTVPFPQKSRSQTFIPYSSHQMKYFNLRKMLIAMRKFRYAVKLNSQYVCNTYVWCPL